MMLTQYRLGLQTVCRMHYLYLRFEIALTKIDESDDNYISYSSAKYVAQHAMENACRWVSLKLPLPSLRIFSTSSNVYHF